MKIVLESREHLLLLRVHTVLGNEEINKLGVEIILVILISYTWSSNCNILVNIKGLILFNQLLKEKSEVAHLFVNKIFQIVWIYPWREVELRIKALPLLALFTNFFVVFAHFLLLAHIQTITEVFREMVNKLLFPSVLNASQIEILPNSFNWIVEKLKEKLRTINCRLNHNIYIGIESLQPFYNLSFDYSLYFTKCIECLEGEGLIKGSASMEYFLTINEIAVNLFEICFMADIYSLEATLLLTDEKFAEVFDLLSLHSTHFKL